MTNDGPASVTPGRLARWGLLALAVFAACYALKVAAWAALDTGDDVSTFAVGVDLVVWIGMMGALLAAVLLFVGAGIAKAVQVGVRSTR